MLIITTTLHSMLIVYDIYTENIPFYCPRLANKTFWWSDRCNISNKCFFGNNICWTRLWTTQQTIYWI